MIICKNKSFKYKKTFCVNHQSPYAQGLEKCNDALEAAVSMEGADEMLKVRHMCTHPEDEE